MKTIARTLEIQAPSERIYNFVATPTNLPSIWPNLVSVSNVVDRGSGSSDFDWVYKMAGVNFNGHANTEEAVPGKIMRVRNEGGIPSTFVWSYEPLDGGRTRLSLAIEYEIPTPVIGKIAEALLAKLNERDADTLLANLKDRMEANVRAAAAAHP